MPTSLGPFCQAWPCSSRADVKKYASLLNSDSRAFHSLFDRIKEGYVGIGLERSGGGRGDRFWTVQGDRGGRGAACVAVDPVLFLSWKCARLSAPDRFRSCTRVDVDRGYDARRERSYYGGSARDPVDGASHGRCEPGGF